MEDDDEFGDLYTDVLRPFASSAPPPPPPLQPQPPRRPIDLNDLQNEDEDDVGGGSGFVFDAPTTSIPGLASGQTLAPAKPDSAAAPSDFRRGAAEDSSLKEEDVTFDIEEEDSGTMIPGLESDSRRDGDDEGTGGGGGGDDDWDSDEESEDDLQIVLNGPTMMMMERGGGMEDEDGDDELVIVADGDPNQAMEEQDWGEDPTAAAGQASDGKDAGEGGKAGVVAVPKVGYGSHGYHPFHSQFKYVRPGAQPILGPATSGPGGVPGQVRPLANMGPTAGRGRGDWRAMGLKNGIPMQKNFHSWGGNGAGRGFGGGMEFTLPSHKTIFDIDIDSFEEKLWKYPGADTSDFFNFGFNEDGWKEYCKQLEQHRLESTMQSKIRVYESGRTEQEFDPDLPPELAAATGIQEVQTENVNPIKSEVVPSEFAKGSARVRPPLPTGRAIQVESGYGERLPSIDTRPPRIRDSDSIIEIVLQGSLDDDSPTGDGVPNQPDDDDHKGDSAGTIAESEISPMDTEYLGKYPQIGTDQKREQVEQKIPFQNSVGNKIRDRDGVLPLPPPPVRNGASCAYISVYPGGDRSPEYEERQTHGRPREKSPNMTPNQNARDKKHHDDMPEDSVESMDSKHSQLSPATRKDSHESSVELRGDVDDQDDAMVDDGRSAGEKSDSPSKTIAATDALEDGATKKQKLNYPLEDSFDQEPDDGEDSRAARSSDNSRARSGSSRDYVKRRDGVEEEVIQRHSNRMGNVKRHFDEKEQGVQRRNRDGRQELERNRVAVKGREDSYPYREFDPNAAHSHMRNDGFERRKERDNPDGAWQRRDDDPYGRRIRAEDTRKRERSNEIGSRHRGKARESERIDKDELIHSRKQMDNGTTTHRVQYDKDSGPRHRERDDNLKGRYDHVDDFHSKRKKEDEYPRREFADKEEMLHGHRENANRWKRERDEVLDQRKRDGQPRPRDSIDDHQSVRQKDESWLQRERGERGREREDWQRVKQSFEENIPKRERDEGRGVTRAGRNSEDKVWAGHPKVKDESNKGSDKDYQYKETARHSEPSKRRDRAEDESSHHGGREDFYARGNQMSNGERRSRQERPRNDRSVTASEDRKFHDKKEKDNLRRNKESDGGDNSSLMSSKRNQEDNGGQTNETGLKGSAEHNISAAPLRQSSKKLKEDASDEEQQQDSRRGRSKLERWTSHTERDFSFKSKPSLKLKEADRSSNPGSLEGSKIPEEPSKPIETVDSQNLTVEERDSTDLDGKDGEPKPSEDRHMDTVEKLKKRSERFKLPMPSDKEAPPTIKKVESESVAPATKTGTPVDLEVKQERPVRKRRWIGN